MAGAGYLLFTAGQVLTAAQVNTYLNQQAVMVFATSAARDSALTSVKSEGMVTYQLDNNDLDIYNGSTFSTLIAPAHGALTTWTPVVVQSNTPTLTNNYSVYQRIGRMIYFQSVVTLTSAGTAANVVTITVPVTMSGSMGTASLVGTGHLTDTSAVLLYPAQLRFATSTTLKFHRVVDSGTDSAYLGLVSFTAALASTDIISIDGKYEAAADA